MQVICINDGEMPSDELNPDVPENFNVKEGEIYTVINSFIAGGYCWYVLAEDPYKYADGTEWGFDSLRFESLTQTDKAVEEVVRVIEVAPTEVKKKKWFEKLFS